ncbi:Lrp/AsnC family transcriptional regulator [Candidatus Woesearchaeota archaeon]|nr:Lrp/AsnC ligand binding domain-containing protein [Candidatus Woesearchaeota archaeon]RLE40891.1 MAG: Lrp/AsnC family transcriptional regulator [Candidatus Woesearchaeota archaeon]RLE44914.1 MAG: Lrp/AsnC family transcriptional regulator [Candidatus Woesearchaeota archaeon]
MPSLAYMLIQTAHGKIQRVADKLLRFKEVKEIHTLYGEFDIIIKIETSNMAKLQDFIANKIRPIRDIASTETLIVSDVF